MGMIFNDGGTSSCSIQPPRQVLGSLPLLVYEYEYEDVDAAAAAAATTDDEQQPEEHTTTTPPRVVDDDPDCCSIPTGMLIYSLSERSIYTHARPQLLAAKGNDCFSTPQGWLLTIDQVSSVWLWHPLTGETITLPPIQDDHYIPIDCKCLLTHSSAAHPECAVVLLDVSDPLMWFCRVNGGSSRRWGQHAYDIGDYDLPEEFRTPDMPTKKTIGDVAALRGKLHFILSESESNQDKICIVDLDFPSSSDHGRAPCADFHNKLDISSKKLEFPEGMCSGTIYLVESMDELFAACICYVDFNPSNIGAVVIYKIDLSGDESTQKQEPVVACSHRVEDIGDRAFLFSGMNMATWCSASSNNLKGNTVYFLKKSADDDGTSRDLCIYDIQEQSMEIVQVHDQDLEIVRTQPYWISVPPC